MYLQNKFCFFAYRKDVDTREEDIDLSLYVSALE